MGNDPTAMAGAMTPYSIKKWMRAMEIARENRLPYVSFVESAGGDLRIEPDDDAKSDDAKVEDKADDAEAEEKPAKKTTRKRTTRKKKEPEAAEAAEADAAEETPPPLGEPVALEAPAPPEPLDFEEESQILPGSEKPEGS